MRIAKLRYPWRHEGHTEVEVPKQAL
eukprot:COSAG06_NODE_36090_length_451_cov_538.582386_2_plen_25_part_01